jgi:hypothetical protein
MTEQVQVLQDERKGNAGRKQWNTQPQSAETAQHMLAGAIRTIDRLLDIIEAYHQQVLPCPTCGHVHGPDGRCNAAW